MQFVSCIYSQDVLAVSSWTKVKLYIFFSLYIGSVTVLCTAGDVLMGLVSCTRYLWYNSQNVVILLPRTTIWQTTDVYMWQTSRSIFSCSSKGLRDTLTTNHNKASVSGWSFSQSQCHTFVCTGVGLSAITEAYHSRCVSWMRVMCWSVWCAAAGIYHCSVVV